MTPGGAASERATTRRRVLGLLGAGALTAALWPRTPRSFAAIPAGRVVIDYWEKWTGPEGDAVQRVVDLFNNGQSRIWVRRIPVSDIASKAVVAISGGDPPDVVGLYSYNIPQLAESGAAMDLGDFGARSLDPEIYAPAVRRLLSHEGRLWAGVSSCYSLALYYNRMLFRQVGLDPDRPPRTIHELDAHAERLLVRTPEGRIERAGFLQNMPAWWPYFWPIMFGGSLYDPASDRAVLTDDRTVRAYQWVQSYPNRLGAAESAEFSNVRGRSYHSTDDPFIAGSVAMIVQGPWITNFIRRYNPGLDYSAVPVPVDESVLDPDRPAGMLEADVLVIPRACPHPEEAIEFVRFTQTQEVQEQLCRDHCKSSPLRAVSEEFMATHPNPCVRVHDAIMRSPAVRVLPQTRVWQPFADMTLGMFDAIWRGAPVRQSLAAVEDRANEMLRSAARMRDARRREARR